MDKQRRSTKSKQLVMNVLNASSTALCHEDIEKQLPQQIDRVTIYRILQGFCDEGRVHKILNEAGKTFYALCRECTQEEHHDNHPHFHCIACDTITCIETQAIEQPLPVGYSAVSETTFISGYCNKCNVLKTLCLLALLFANGIFAFFTEIC